MYLIDFITEHRIDVLNLKYYVALCFIFYDSGNMVDEIFVCRDWYIAYFVFRLFVSHNCIYVLSSKLPMSFLKYQSIYLQYFMEIDAAV